jgi:hypothetical protein
VSLHITNILSFAPLGNRGTFGYLERPEARYPKIAAD